MFLLNVPVRESHEQHAKIAKVLSILILGLYLAPSGTNAKDAPVSGTTCPTLGNDILPIRGDLFHDPSLIRLIAKRVIQGIAPNRTVYGVALVEKPLVWEVKEIFRSHVYGHGLEFTINKCNGKLENLVVHG